VTREVLLLLSRAPAKGNSTAIKMGQEDGLQNKETFPTVTLAPRIFYAISINWNICTGSNFCKPNNIFKHAGGGDSMKEVCVESFYNEKIMLLFKNHS
jgi:hypothetical protein